ncbi:MAG: hypothetical protein KAY05_03915, partial [Aeromonadaceae bacterium]|nr:hypothetical protein [Aeromonadaceae bacterium]MBP8772920.1 hypothetical protein [Aeromonadaceae bacterium]
MRTSLLLAVVLISVIGLGGCQQPQASRQPEPAPLLAQNQLTMAQNGSSLTLKVGEQVAVALPG